MNNDYDVNESDGRSYISAVSEIVLDPEELCEGHAKNTMGEARIVSPAALESLIYSSLLLRVYPTAVTTIRC